MTTMSKCSAPSRGTCVKTHKEEEDGSHCTKNWTSGHAKGRKKLRGCGAALLSTEDSFIQLSLLKKMMETFPLQQQMMPTSQQGHGPVAQGVPRP